MTEFQSTAAAVSLRKMFRGSHFDICTFDKVARLADIKPRGKDYEALSALHCVHWSEMPEGMPQQVLDRCLRMLGEEPLDLSALRSGRNGEPARLFQRLRGMLSGGGEQ